MPDQPTRYRIVKLTASNIKRLKAVEVIPSGDVVTIGGANDQGKTSLLDAIQMACAGAGAVPEQPIRHGATKGEVVVDLGDLIITKTFTAASGQKLKVQMKDGSPVSSPQAILDALCNKISYDPMEWLRMKPDKQLEMLRQLVGVDFTDLNRRHGIIYTKRTDTGRDLAQKKARRVTMTTHEDVGADEVSVADLMKQLNAVRSGNSANEKVHDASNSALNALSAKKAEASRFDVEIATMRIALENKIKQRDSIEKEVEICQTTFDESRKLAEAVVDADESPILKQIEEADGINRRVRENNSAALLATEIYELEHTVNEHTAALDAIESEKQQLLKSAKFPLSGLSFDDSGVLLDGVPFSQAGTAKKIRASVAIGLAMNPRLRVILIRDGSLLDNTSMKLIADVAKEQDVQVWIEKIVEKDEHGKYLGTASVIIEDGSIKEV